MSPARRWPVSRTNFRAVDAAPQTAGDHFGREAQRSSESIGDRGTDAGHQRRGCSVGRPEVSDGSLLSSANETDDPVQRIAATPRRQRCSTQSILGSPDGSQFLRAGGTRLGPTSCLAELPGICSGQSPVGSDFKSVVDSCNRHPAGNCWINCMNSPARLRRSWHRNVHRRARTVCIRAIALRRLAAMVPCSRAQAGRRRDFPAVT